MHFSDQKYIRLWHVTTCWAGGAGDHSRGDINNWNNLYTDHEKAGSTNTIKSKLTDIRHTAGRYCWQIVRHLINRPEYVVYSRHMQLQFGRLCSNWHVIYSGDYVTSSCQWMCPQSRASLFSHLLECSHWIPVTLRREELWSRCFMPVHGYTYT